MVKPKEPRLRVGLTLIAFTALLFTLVFSLDSVRSMVDGNRVCRVRFADVQGLRPSDPVHFHGIPCGHVRSVTVTTTTRVPALDPNTAYAEGRIEDNETPSLEVELELEVPDDMFVHLRDGSTATIQKTLTGVTVVNIQQGTGDPIADGELIQGEATATFADVTIELQNSAGKLTSILSEVEPLIVEIREEALVRQALESLNGAADEISELASSIRGVVDTNREDIAAILDDIRNATSALDDLILDVNALVYRIEDAVPDFQNVAKSIRSAADRGTELAANFDSFVTERKPELQAAIEYVRKTAQNAKSFTEEIRRRPWRLLHTPDEAEVEKLLVLESAAAYSEATAELRRGLEQMARLAEMPNSPENDELMAMAKESVEMQLAKLNQAERRYWEKLRELYPE